MLPRLFPLTLLALFSAHTAFAQHSQDGPPIDPRQMLYELEQIKTKSSASSKGRQQKVLADLAAAAASGSRAIDFYEQAIRATRFAGQSLQQTQFQEWKKKEGEKLRSQEMQTAAQLHLQYLSLSLQHAWGTPIEELVPSLFQYTNQIESLMENEAKRPGYLQQDLLRKGINESVFVRWYGLARDLPGAKQWELVPMRVDGIYAKTILPQMRANKDPRIVQYWDQRIQREARRVEEGRRTFEQEQFNYIGKPKLLWQRAQDLLAIGQKNRAIAEMFAVVRGYPEHPEALAHIEQLEKLITPPAPAPATAETPETAPEAVPVSTEP